jgi:CheY-like chemotaxis protein
MVERAHHRSSVRSDEGEKVRLLELGADDYVVKPFGMAEAARSCPRRLAAPHNGPTHFGMRRAIFGWLEQTLMDASTAAHCP